MEQCRNAVGQLIACSQREIYSTWDMVRATFSTYEIILPLVVITLICVSIVAIVWRFRVKLGDL